MLIIDPTKLIGSVRTFGAFGPAYEVVQIKEELPDGDAIFLVNVIESGEELEYRASHVISDPEAD